jgi:hypothetical protein
MRPLPRASIACRSLVFRAPGAGGTALRQVHPDFSGTWKIVREKTTGTLTYGPQFTAKQDLKSLTIQMGAADQAATYSLDGSESTHAVRPGLEMTSIAHWDGEQLVIVTRAPSPKAQEITRVLRLDSKRELTVETSLSTRTDKMITVYSR